jgi:hypothetical protein
MAEFDGGGYPKTDGSRKPASKLRLGQAALAETVGAEHGD